LSEQDHQVQQAIAANVPDPEPVVTPVAKPKQAAAPRVASAAPVTRKERKLADIIATVKTENHRAGTSK
jgi:hypothetical protein